MVQRVSYSFPLLRNPLQTLQQWSVELRKSFSAIFTSFTPINLDFSYLGSGAGFRLQEVGVSQYKIAPNQKDISFFVEFQFSNLAADGWVAGYDYVELRLPESFLFIKEDGIAFVGMGEARIPSTSTFGAVIIYRVGSLFRLYRSGTTWGVTTGANNWQVSCKFEASIREG